jgi:hypothetical protein
MGMNKLKVLNNGVHFGLLKKLYPQGRLISSHPGLIWECEFRPNPLSQPYKIRLVYRNNEKPQIYVTSGKLGRGKLSKLPHVYSSDEQSLCLHYPSEKSWTPAINIADTIIPWAAEWLYHYEIWLVTGEWNGGGTVH